MTDWQSPVDLDNCAAEPIHVPGAIQPHGTLFAVDPASWVIEVVSANVESWWGVTSDDAIGRPLASVIGDERATVIVDALRNDYLQRADELALPGEVPLVAAAHHADDRIVVEIETDGPAPQAAQLVRESAVALQLQSSVVGVLEEAARAVRAVTGFDRVMVYRFDAEWNGEVVAEERRDDLNSFRGLHYPASDIPAQARELYRRNWLRLIPDIGYAPVPLVPASAFDAARPLDLSGSMLRSVSPIHVEYLSNMGVTASMSVSIIVDGNLWGLIACHHYAGTHLPVLGLRNAAAYLGQLVSLRVAETEARFQAAQAVELNSYADHAAEGVEADAADIAAHLADREADVLKLAGATGAVVKVNDDLITLGVTPSVAVLQELLRCWPENELVFETDDLSSLCPPATDHLDTAAGLLAVPLTSDRREYVLWFREEIVRSVDWGGDPHNAKLYEGEGDDVRLSPRKSFDLWREVVRGRAQPWSPTERLAAERFARRIARALTKHERDAMAVANDLQRALLPQELPRIDGWYLDAHYRPAGAGRVGGDWYDALLLGPRRLAFVLGDVAGHGLGAAAEMAQIRNALRAYLLDDDGPARALERVDHLVVRLLDQSIATIACGVVDLDTGVVDLSSAGHPPAVVVDREGARFADGEGDAIIGLDMGGRRSTRVELAPGDVLIAYSDGLVERRDADPTARSSWFRAEVERLGPALLQPGAARRVVDFASEGADDDLTAIIVGRTGSGA
jgi:chemotaxis family two-component system sensor kinase Cph1